MFISILRKEYLKRLSSLQKRKEIAEVEITKLYALRQALIEKNLSGIYSDQIFKEQNAVIEEKISTTHMNKNGMLIQQYNLEKIVETVKSYFDNLGQTYLNSNLTIKRILLGSIFAQKLVWSYPGISNRQISPLYQCIRAFDDGIVPFGDPCGSRTHPTGMKTLFPNR